MITRKAYKDLVIADFIGMTAEQIRDVLESYKKDEERMIRYKRKLAESAAKYLNS